MNMKKLNMKKLASILGVSLGFALAAGPVQSIPPLWSFEDDDIDFILDGSTLAPKTSGTIGVGDLFVSVFEIPVFKIDGANAIPSGQELTGVAAIELKAILDNNPAGDIGDQLIFKPYSGGLNSILGLGFDPDASVPFGGLGEGAAIAMWFNGTDGSGGDRDLEVNRTVDPASNCVSLADCIDQASLGELLQVDGFFFGDPSTADPDNFWVATITADGGLNIGTVLTTNNSTIVASANFGLSNLYNTRTPVHFIDIATGTFCGAPGFIADRCVQVSGSGTITGGQGLSNGAIAHSDFDAQKFVPEPATLALLGAGLLGLGIGRRKLQNA